MRLGLPPEPSRMPGERADASDAALLERLASGQADGALEQLYDRFATRVYRLGLRALSDPDLAEDLVQETFTRIWRSAARFDSSRGSAAGWVMTIARNAAVDTHRRRPPAHGELVAEPVADDDAFEQLVTGLVVREALEALCPAHREVLELAYDRGQTQTEIAAALQLPLGTVKSRTYHALRELREVLAERGIDA
jgi:RNA polymerase sigma-70 factor (ECF subfamily)